jgi:preprotein translocase subunit SecG
MNIFVVLIHVIACIALIAIVLLQTGKGAEMGAAFGGASQTLFGGTGGTSFMGKLTTGAAVVFMLTCLWLSYRPSTAGSRSIMPDTATEQTVPAPAPPAPLLPEARPVQPEQPAASEQAAPLQAPEASSAQPAAQQPPAATSQEGSQTKTPPAKAQPQPEQPQKQKAPAKK